MNLHEPALRKAMLGGLIATLALTFLMYTAPLAGLPSIDMASAIGGFLDRPADVFSARWWAGLAVFFVVGIVIYPLAFIHLVPMLIGNAWQRGLEWGVLLWGAGGVCVMFFLGLAFHPPFTTSPYMSALVTFVGNLFYGLILGVIAARAAGLVPRTSAL